MPRWFRLIFILLIPWATGCKPVVDYIAQVKEVGDPRLGITFYLGGAGPIGHVGSWDIPSGLSEGGYTGSVEVFSWQGMIHAADQINITRNHEKGLELAGRIQDYRRRYPQRDINIIALSAGTGVATFALENLPEGAKINRVIYLGCSLSSRYDLTRALKRVNSGLYVLYSPYDRILSNLVWYTGTVDRRSATDGIAGMDGFRLPSRIGQDTDVQYTKIFNIEYREEFSLTGYEGGHTDGTSKAFVRDYLAPALCGNDRRLLGAKYASYRYQRAQGNREAASQPTTAKPSRREPSMEEN